MSASYAFPQSPNYVEVYRNKIRIVHDTNPRGENIQAWIDRGEHTLESGDIVVHATVSNYATPCYQVWDGGALKTVSPFNGRSLIGA